MLFIQRLIMFGGISPLILGSFRTSKPKFKEYKEILEYLSQINNKTVFLHDNIKFKFSIKWIFRILSIGILSYNFKFHVASDIPTKGFYISNSNSKIQDYLNQIGIWTSSNKMTLIKNKGKVGGRVTIENEVLESVKETKLLGVMENGTPTHLILLKEQMEEWGYSTNLLFFCVPVDDLLNIYTINMYVRSILEPGVE